MTKRVAFHPLLLRSFCLRSALRALSFRIPFSAKKADLFATLFEAVGFVRGADHPLQVLGGALAAGASGEGTGTAPALVYRIQQV